MMYETPNADGQSILTHIRQLDAQSALAQLKALDPIAFEHLTAALFAERGYSVETTDAVGDEGVDVYLRRGSHTAIVQCKRYEGSVGQPTVRDLYGTMVHHEADAAFLVTTGTITRQAEEWAFGKPIHLIDGYALAREIVKAGQATRAAESTRGGGRVWLWPTILAVLIVFGFAVGIAFTRVIGRVRTEPPPVVNPPATPTVNGATNATDVSPTATVPPSGVVITTTVTATASAESEVAAPTPTPCPQPVADSLRPLYSRPALGCPETEAQVLWSAWEPFERGYMLWRSDTDNAYAFFDGDARTWFPIEQGWEGGAAPDRGEPPPGLLKPARGFGYVWSVRDDLFQNLGWATDIERGFCAEVQTFAHGFILQSVAVPSCTADNLYNQATAADWRPVILVAHESGIWNSTALNANTSPGTGPQPVPESETGSDVVAAARTRPPDHGLFPAPAAGALTLDGDVRDWPDAWLPIDTIVAGGGEHSGSRDLSGEFQARWSSAGLYLAVRVRDEAYRAAPEGTLMWQGDGLEIHFDRQLAADYARTGVDGDDYQLGVSYGPNLNEIRGYRWYPYEQESALQLNGGVQYTLDEGYTVELLIPWPILNVSGADLASGDTFGFNISINDNDGDAPAQQTVLSASTARTTYDNPTEWGTLQFTE